MKHTTVDLGGDVHYVEWDGPSDGPVFLLLHGLGGSWLNWKLLGPRLATRGRVFAMDFIGFGRTPPHGRRSTMEANRALAKRFITEVVGRPPILVGNSMGGLISILLASTEPDDVSGVVLIDPASPSAGVKVDATVAALFATYMIPKAGERLLEARARKLGPEGLVQETLDLCCVDSGRVDAELVAEMKTIARERMGSMPYAATVFLEATRSMIRTLARRRVFTQKVQAISAPTLLLQGRHDRLVSFAATEAIALARPDWDFVVFEDLGHVPQLEDPAAVFAEIERWLESTGLARVTEKRAQES